MKIVDWLLIQMIKRRRLEMIALDFLRHQLNKNMIIHSGYKVQFGLFKGMDLNKSSGWDEAGSISTKILGLYEQEILNELEQMEQFETLINIGAADGYYSFGLLQSKKCRRAIVFESDAQSRNQILEQKLNLNLDVSIFEEATSESLGFVVQNLDMTNVVLIADIEGAEFNLFDERTIAKLAGATLILEIHDFLSPSYDKELLESNFIKLFKVKKIKNNKRELPDNSFFNKLHDNQKWLLISEGRLQTMEWWILTPRTAGAKNEI